MSYEVHGFQTGDRLYASQLNQMDSQIYANHMEIHGEEGNVTVDYSDKLVRGKTLNNQTGYASDNASRCIIDEYIPVTNLIYLEVAAEGQESAGDYTYGYLVMEYGYDYGFLGSVFSDIRNSPWWTKIYPKWDAEYARFPDEVKYIKIVGWTNDVYTAVATYTQGASTAVLPRLKAVENVCNGGSYEYTKEERVEVGTIDGSNGQPYGNTNRRRTKDYISASGLYQVTLNTDGGKAMAFYYDKNKVYLSRSSSSFTLTGDIYPSIFPAGTGYVKFIVNKATDDFAVTTYYVKSNKGIVDQVEKLSDFYSKGNIQRHTGTILNAAYSTIYMAAINTMEHYMTAAKLGFNALKGDCRLTSDGNIIMCHDAGFTLDSDGRITTYSASASTTTGIHDMTAAECTALEHSTGVSALCTDHYQHPCTIDDYLLICKQYGMIPYVTLRSDYTASTLEVIIAKLYKYGLRNSAIINCYHSWDDIASVVRTKDNDITISCTLESGEVLTKETVDQCAEYGNVMITMFNITKADSYTQSAEGIAYAQSLGIPVCDCQVSSDSGVYNSRIHDGIIGFQMTRAILPYRKTSYTFSVTNTGTMGGYFKYTAPYTATVAVSGNTMSISNITQTGSARGFADGIMPLWMNNMPYTLQVRAASGQNCSIVWQDNALKITANSLSTTDTFYVCVEV